MTSLAHFEIELPNEEIITIAYYDYNLQLKINDDGSESVLSEEEQEYVKIWIDDNINWVNHRVKDFLKILHD